MSEFPSFLRLTNSPVYGSITLYLPHHLLMGMWSNPIFLSAFLDHLWDEDAEVELERQRGETGLARGAVRPPRIRQSLYQPSGEVWSKDYPLQESHVGFKWLSPWTTVLLNHWLRPPWKGHGLGSKTEVNLKELTFGDCLWPPSCSWAKCPFLEVISIFLCLP